MITPARHVYQAGSRVGADSDGSWMNRQPRTSSRIRANPTITHHVPRRFERPSTGGTACSSTGAFLVSVTILPWWQPRRCGRTKDRGRVRGLRSRRRARATEPYQVDAVAHGGEPRLAREGVERVFEPALQAARQVKVLHAPAAGAQEMVMVPGELLRELVPGEAVLRGDPPDQPGGLQLGEVPVGGALGEVPTPSDDVRE